MHPAIIIGTVRSLIVDVAMGQILRSTERISSFIYIFYNLNCVFLRAVVINCDGNSAPHTTLRELMDAGTIFALTAASVSCCCCSGWWWATLTTMKIMMVSHADTEVSGGCPLPVTEGGHLSLIRHPPDVCRATCCAQQSCYVVAAQ